MQLTARSNPKPTPRSGNAIVLSLALVVVIGSLLATTTTSSVATLQWAVRESDRQTALSAVNMVISRRELRVVQLGQTGDPESFVDYQDNFGVDQVGSCTVQWKVSPVHTPPKNALGQVQDYIANPPPQEPTGTVDSHQLPNDTVYLYEVAAKATITNGDQILASAQGVRYTSVLKTPLFQYVIFYAQRGPKGDLELSHGDNLNIKGSVHTNGALYIGAQTKVNDWATLAGPGSYTRIGPATRGSDTNVPVKVIGVDGIFCLSKPLLYGMMNKLPLGSPALQRVGAETLTNYYDTSTADSYPRDAEAIQALYRMTSDPATLAAHTGPLITTNLGAVGSTNAVDYINPYRVRNYTTGSLATRNSGFSGSQTDQLTARTINRVSPGGLGIPILGADIGTTQANDSRDGATANTQGRWRQLSTGPGTSNPAGFNGHVRTSLTGGSVKQLPTNLIGVEGAALRPLEPQALRYVTSNPLVGGGLPYDSDPTTDDHEWATPLFRTDAIGTTTTDPGAFWDTNGVLLEEPGKYLRHALGDGRFLARRPETHAKPGTGWDVYSFASGAPAAITASAAPLGKVGLIIRERPVPNTDIWPGTVSVPPLPRSDPNSLPFAYGKAFRPGRPKITPIDVDHGTWAGADYGAWFGAFGWQVGSTRAKINETTGGPAQPDRSFELTVDGTLTVRSKASPGVYFPKGTGTNPSSTEIRSGVMDRERLGNTDRYTYFYNDSWRFFHLKQPNAAVPQPGGVTWRTFDDGFPKSQAGAGRYWGNNINNQYLQSWGNTRNGAENVYDCVTGSALLTGKPFSVGSSGTAPTNLPPHVNSPLGGEYFSYRLEGFLVPEFSESYFIGAVHDDGVKIWFDGKLLSETNRWSFTGQGEAYGGYTERLTAGQAYPIVVEYFFQGGNGRGLTTKWSSATRTIEEIPIASSNTGVGWHQTDPNYGFKKPGGTTSAPTGFKSIQGRIKVPSLSLFPSGQRLNDRSLADNTLHKVGLMLRDGAAGLSPWLSGRDAYVMIGYNRIRGVFVQQRRVAAETWYSEARVPKWFVGAGASFKEEDQSGNIRLPTSDSAGEVDSYLKPLVTTSGQTEPYSFNNKRFEYSNYVLAATMEKYREVLPVPTPTVTQTPVDVANNSLRCEPQEIIEEGRRHSVTVRRTGGVISRTVKPRKTIYPYWNQTIYLRLNSALPPLQSGDDGKTLTLYNLISPFGQRWSGKVSVTPPTEIKIVEGDPNFDTYSTDGSDITSPIATRADRTYENNVVFVRDGQINGKTAEYIKNSMNSNSAGGCITWILPSSGNAWPDSNGFLKAPRPTITQAHYDAVTDPTIPPGTVGRYRINIPNGNYYFAIDRGWSNRDVYQDINSWVSRTGVWNATPVPQVVPWTTAWNLPGVERVKTYSHRPDLWGSTNVASVSGDVFNTYQALNAGAGLVPIIPDGVTNPSARTPWYLTDDIPTPPSTASSPPWSDEQKLIWDPNLESVWLRIEQDPDQPKMVRFAWSPKSTQPLDSEWQYVTKDSGTTSVQGRDNANASPDILRIDLSPSDTRSIWGGQTDPTAPNDQILAGPCFQNAGFTSTGNGTSAAFTATMSDLKVVVAGDSADVNGDGVIDTSDWFSPTTGSSASPESAYLASQYQVLWGPYDITEDFFTWQETQGNAGRTAWEDWMYSPREFWSQSRYWYNAAVNDTFTDARHVDKEKDPGGHSNLANRLALAQTTLLTLNMGRYDAINQTGIQGYLRNRRLVDAVQNRPFTDSQNRNPPAVYLGDQGLLLKDSFNGLIYAARTNRYPWNPTIPNGSTYAGMNLAAAWDLGANLFPNTTPNLSGTNPLADVVIANRANLNGLTASRSANRIDPATRIVYHRLQSYTDLLGAPATKPQDFHHGVRVVNASDIHWGFPNPTGATAGTFGESKTSIVTPNQLYLCGDVNTIDYPLTTRNAQTPVRHTAPLAVMGDVIHLLSNAFSPYNPANPVRSYAIPSIYKDKSITPPPAPDPDRAPDPAPDPGLDHRVRHPGQSHPVPGHDDHLQHLHPDPQSTHHPGHRSGRSGGGVRRHHAVHGELEWCQHVFQGKSGGHGYASLHPGLSARFGKAVWPHRLRHHGCEW